MFTAQEIRDLRFEKAAFGYKQEDIDEFLNRLEHEVEIAQQELDDSNGKIQVLADKVREYMRDEDALRDALFNAQKEAHRIVDEANARADEIIAKAKEKADAMMDEVTVKHDALLERNEQQILEQRGRLTEARQQVADFKRAIFDMYKEHLGVLSEIPEEDDFEFGISSVRPAAAITENPAPAPAETAEEVKEAVEFNSEPAPAETAAGTDPFAAAQAAQNAEKAAAEAEAAYQASFGEYEAPMTD